MIRVEYTIEPFVEGDIPARVTLAAEALERLGITVDIGVFGSSFEVESASVGEALSVLVTTAYSHGATHVTIDLEEMS
ncbi:MAG: hypothetical protein RIR69_1336 [Actinomycetota bacterium]